MMMSKRLSSNHLSFDINQDLNRNGFDPTIESVALPNGFAQTNNDVIPQEIDSNREGCEGEFIEDIVVLPDTSTNSHQKNGTQKLNKRKRSAHKLDEKDSNDSPSCEPIDETKGKKNKRKEFTARRRLNRLKISGFNDHHYIIDEKKPETRLKCVVCSKYSTKGHWSIAAKSKSTVEKHLETETHKKCVQQFRNSQNESLINQIDSVNSINHSGKVIDLDSVSFDGYTCSEYSENKYQQQLNELYQMNYS